MLLLNLFSSNVHYVQSGSRMLEITFLLLCWRDESQCRQKVKEVILTKIGTRTELQLQNSMSSIGLILQNIFLRPEDPNDKIPEKFSVQETGDGGYMLSITAIATVIGISIGLILVLLAVVRTGSILHPFHLGNRDRQEDLQQIRSPDDTPTIQGKVFR